MRLFFSNLGAWRHQTMIFPNYYSHNDALLLLTYVVLHILYFAKFVHNPDKLLKSSAEVYDGKK